MQAQRCLAVAALALAVRNAFVAYEDNAWHLVVTGKGSALVFYPFAAADHNNTYSVDDHAMQRARELAATVVRVGRVGAASNWLARAAPNSLRHVSLGGHATVEDAIVAEVDAVHEA